MRWCKYRWKYTLKPAWLGRMAWGVALLVTLGACTPHLEIYPQLERLSRQGAYAEAAALVEKKQKSYEARNAVLFHLDRGVLYHYAKQYKKSNDAFALAEAGMDALFTESIARQTAAFLSNDNTLPFRGEDFETVQIHIYRALNHLQLGQNDAALVEARKLNEKLEFINSKYPSDKRNTYKEDAFARLLSGMLYELGGSRVDLNDAFIANRNAATLYEKDFTKHYGVSAPDVLKNNLLRTATFMGNQELAAARKTYPRTPVPSLAKRRGKAQLIFIHFLGLGPVKKEEGIVVPTLDGYHLRIAFPRYLRRNYAVHGSSISIAGKATLRLQQATSIGSIAIRNLKDRWGRIKAKAIARAITKYLASKTVAHAAVENKLVAGLIGSVTTTLTERADLRTWRTLPDQVLIGRVWVKPGVHELAAQWLSSDGGNIGEKPLGRAVLRAGETRFFILHTNR